MAAKHDRSRERHETRGADEADEVRRSVETQAENVARGAERMTHEAQQQLEVGARQFAAMGERVFEAWMQNQNETMSRVLEINMELANWGREQIDDGINAVRSMAQSRTVGDAYGVQLNLLRNSMEKSMRHANNLFNLTTRAMVGGMQQMQRSGRDMQRERNV